MVDSGDLHEDRRGIGRQDLTKAKVSTTEVFQYLWGSRSTQPNAPDEAIIRLTNWCDPDCGWVWWGCWWSKNLAKAKNMSRPTEAPILWHFILCTLLKLFCHGYKESELRTVPWCPQDFSIPLPKSIILRGRPMEQLPRFLNSPREALTKKKSSNWKHQDPVVPFYDQHRRHEAKATKTAGCKSPGLKDHSKRATRNNYIVILLYGL